MRPVQERTDRMDKSLPFDIGDLEFRYGMSHVHPSVADVEDYAVRWSVEAVLPDGNGGVTEKVGHAYALILDLEDALDAGEDPFAVLDSLDADTSAIAAEILEIGTGNLDPDLRNALRHRRHLGSGVGRAALSGPPYRPSAGSDGVVDVVTFHACRTNFSNSPFAGPPPRHAEARSAGSTRRKSRTGCSSPGRSVTKTRADVGDSSRMVARGQTSRSSSEVVARLFKRHARACQPCP